jgi:predicted porin
MSALFNLESGYNADTGVSSSATTFFNRQSWVGVAAEGVGQVTMGLQLPTISDVFVTSANTSYFGSQAAAIDGSASAAGASAARFNNMIGGTRVVNSIKLTSASFAGLKLSAMTALGEVGGSSKAGRMDSVGLSYGYSQFEAGLAYHRTNCVESAGCPAGKDTDKIYGIGGAYKFTAGGRLGINFTNQKNAKNIVGNDASMLGLIAIIPVDLWTIMAGYQILNDKSALNQDVRQLNLGLKYLLSKRTELYTLYSRQSVDNGGKASMFSQLSSDGRQSQYSIGIRHSF